MLLAIGWPSDAPGSPTPGNTRCLQETCVPVKEQLWASWTPAFSLPNLAPECSTRKQTPVSARWRLIMTVRHRGRLTGCIPPKTSCVFKKRGRCFILLLYKKAAGQHICKKHLVKVLDLTPSHKSEVQLGDELSVTRDMLLSYHH